MLLEALSNKAWKDEYKIHAWSYEKGQEILLATITLDQDKQLVVTPSDAGAPLYARMGLLPTNSNDSYSIDLAEAPATLVATALGLPGNSQGFLRGLQEDLGHYPSAYDILEVALQGHPEQSGRLNASGSEDRVLKIPVNHFVDLMAENAEAPKDLYVRHQDEYQGMTKSSVLAKNGSLIIPAYLVTVDSDPHGNANDRLAIYAAALKEAGSIDGVLADKPLKFVRTADGKAALLVQDATKPSFTALGVVPSARNADILQVSVRSAQLEAKRSLENGATLIRSKDEPSVRAFVQVSALQDLVQDSQGLSVNMPRKSESGQVRAERLNVPRHMTVEGLGAMITASASQVAERAGRQAIGIQGSSDIGDQAVQKLRSFARKASSFLAELERLPTALAPEEPAKAARVYDIMDLS